MEDVRIKGWYTSPPSSRTPYFYTKDVFDMTPVERLIAAGIRPDCARETIMWFRAQGDDYGLEKYLNEVEARKGVPANGRIS